MKERVKKMEEAKVQEVELNNESVEFDDTAENIPVEVEIKHREIPVKEEKKKTFVKDEDYVSCLRNEKIIVRYISKEDGVITNPNHVLYGGLAENAVRTFCVPRLSSGTFVNVLTDSEKKFLEAELGLEHNAMSIYKKVDNFWSDSNQNGISQVNLHKGDNYFDLSVPEDYIRYKILLSNKDLIAPSMIEYEKYPKATYQFVIISDGEESKIGMEGLNSTMKSYLEFGKIEDEPDLLSVIIEIMEGRPVAKKTKLEWMKTKIHNLIQKNSKHFLKVITDPMLRTKALIKKAVEAGAVNVRGGLYYVKQDGNLVPLCNDGEDPTFEMAARFLNLPKNQELKFMIEAKTK